MKVAPHSGQEEVVQVFGGRRSARLLPLHDGNQVLSDLIKFVTSEQVGDFTARQDVVHIFCRREERSVEPISILKLKLNNQTFMTSVPRKASSLMSLSVKRNVTPFPC